MKTRIITTVICLLLAGLVSAAPALAEDNGKSRGDTMNVMKADQVPDDIKSRLHVPDQATGDIDLPESASIEGNENSAYGRGIASEAREQRRQFGMERSQQSMEEARGEQTREQTKERLMNREVLQDRTQDGHRGPR